MGRSVSMRILFLLLATMAGMERTSIGQTVSGGGVTLDMSSEGTVRSVTAGGRLLPASHEPGGFFIRDLRRVGIPGTILFSDGFEDSSGHGWEYYGQTQDRKLIIRTTEYSAHTGQGSLLIRVDQADYIQRGRIVSPESSAIPVRPGKRYRIQCLYKATRGYLSDNPGSINMQRNAYKPSGGYYINGIGVIWLDSAGVAVAEHINVAPFMDQAGEWKAVGGVVTAPDDAVSARVTLSASLDPDYDLEGFFVDQVEFFEDGSRLERVLGSVTAKGSGELAFASKIETFKVNAEIFNLNNGVMVAGSVQALDGKHHPLDLHFSIPVDGEGLTWPVDTEEEEVIDSTVSSWYANEVSLDSQSNLPASLYPYGGVHSAESGIGLCVPLESLRTASIGYDAKRQCLDVCFRIGLDPNMGRDTAGFMACIIDYEPEHGFRGIIAAYNEFFWSKPDWFSTTFDPSLFNRVVKGNFHSAGGARKCLECDQKGYLACQYSGTDFMAEKLVPAGQGYPPTLDEILQKIELRQSSIDPPIRYYYTRVWPEAMRSHNNDPVLKFCKKAPNGWIQAQFKITPSIVIGAEGFIQYTSNFNLIPAFEATANPDPSWNVDPSVLDAVLLDNFLNQSSVDFDNLHIADSAHDLTYSQNSYQLGLTPAAGARDLTCWLRGWLDLHVSVPRRQIVVNWVGIGTSNASVPWVDLFVDEVFNAVTDGEYGGGRDGSFNPEVLRYRRAIVYQKCRSQQFNGQDITHDDVEDTLHTYLLYAMGGETGNDITFKEPSLFGWDQCVALVEAHNDIAADLHNAGWEPLTFADCATPDIFLERYGAPEFGEFYVVILNDGTATASGTITLREGLGLVAKPEVTEVISGTKYTVHGSGPEWTVDFQNLADRRALVFKIE